MQPSAKALHQRIRAFLAEDRVLAACGFTSRTVGQEVITHGPAFGGVPRTNS